MKRTIPLVLIMMSLFAGVTLARVSWRLGGNADADLVAAGAQQLYSSAITHNGRAATFTAYRLNDPAAVRLLQPTPELRLIRFDNTLLTIRYHNSNTEPSTPTWPSDFPAIGSAVPIYSAQSDAARYAIASTTETPGDALQRLDADLRANGWIAPPANPGTMLYTRGNAVCAIDAFADDHGRTTLSVIQRSTR